MRSKITFFAAAVTFGWSLAMVPQQSQAALNFSATQNEAIRECAASLLPMSVGVEYYFFDPTATGQGVSLYSSKIVSSNGAVAMYVVAHGGASLLMTGT